MIFIFPVAAYVLVRAVLPPLSSLLTASGLVRENYRGDNVPVPLGLVFPLVLPVVYAALGFWRPDFPRPALFPLLFYITGMGFLGLCDDLLKDNRHKGLRGHLTALAGGRLTSGAIKAVFGLAFSLLFAAGIRAPGENPALLVLRAPVAALAANTLNLFDLRPGRAVKAFLLFAFLPFLFFGGSGNGRLYLLLVLPALGAVPAYLPHDLKARGMLGDTGANFLGALLGGLLVICTGPLPTGGAFFVLILLQILAEKTSFTRLIAGNRVLRFLDEWGRD